LAYLVRHVDGAEKTPLREVSSALASLETGKVTANRTIA